MRKIEKDMCEAITKGKDFKSGNTEVIFSEVNKKHYVILLFGNKIAQYTGSLQISNAGWVTQTTRSRLNAICYSRISIKKGEMYLDGELMEKEKWYSVT